MTRRDVFTYGTLVFDEVMAAVAGRAGESVAALLEGYERRLLRGAVFPGIAPRPGSRVHGRLWLALGPGELDRLDRFEGQLYERRRVEVVVGAARRPAQAYVVTLAHRWMMTRRPWEPETFRARSLVSYARRAGHA